ncbi:MAG: L-threonylcarbamoyladenylate synthase [Candidatus Doudnabacteria bacterium]
MKQIDQAVRILKSGGVVVYPTDTAYGLAVDAANFEAVKKLYRLKGRNFSKPIHVIPPTNDIRSFAAVTPFAQKLIKKLMPGPITVVLPLRAKGRSWQLLSARTETIGIRRPKNRLALALAKKLGNPITATSANKSGGANTYTIKEVQEQFKEGLKPDFYLDGGKLKQTKPSTVVSIGDGRVRILRQGPISEKQIKKICKTTSTIFRIK